MSRRPGKVLLEGHSVTVTFEVLLRECCAAFAGAVGQTVSVTTIHHPMLVMG